MTNRTEYLKRHKLPSDTSLSKADISKMSKIPVSILNDVYDRGIGAYKTNPESVRLKGSFRKDPSVKDMSEKLSKERWAIARVYGFIMENPKQVGANHSFANHYSKDLIKKRPNKA